MPSATTSMVGPNADLDFYFTSVQAAYLRALKGTNRAFYQQIAMVVGAGVKKEVSRYNYQGEVDGRITNMTGTRVKFPIRLAASRPRVWPQGQPRPVEQFAEVDLSLDMQRWCPPSKRESWVVWSNDIYGLIKEQLPDMMDRSVILWDEVLAEALARNAPWQPDGVPFFTPAATPHPANPAKPGQFPFFNDIPITGMDVGEMSRVIGILTSQPGPDGVVLDTDNVDIWVVVPNDELGFKTKAVFQNAIVFQSGTTGAAGVTNTLQGVANVQVWKVLQSTLNQPTFGGNPQDRSKIGYMFAVPKGEGKPLVVVPSIEPTPYYTGLNGSDHLRASMGEVEFGWDAFGQGGLAIPHRAVRFIINPA